MRTGLVFLGFLACGLTGALAARVLFPPEDPARPPAPVSTSRIAELEARIDELTVEVASLATPRPPPVAPRDEPRIVPAEAAARIEPGAAATASPAMVPDTVIEEKVREVIRERVEAAAEEKARREAVAQAEKDTRFLKKLQGILDLTDYQREELGVHLQTRRAAYAEYKRKLAEEGPDISPGRRETLEQDLRDFVSVQDEDMRRLLGVETFNELMRITSGKGGR